MLGLSPFPFQMLSVRIWLLIGGGMVGGIFVSRVVLFLLMRISQNKGQNSNGKRHTKQEDVYPATVNLTIY